MDDTNDTKKEDRHKDRSVLKDLEIIAEILNKNPSLKKRVQKKLEEDQETLEKNKSKPSKINKKK